MKHVSEVIDKLGGAVEISTHLTKATPEDPISRQMVWAWKLRESIPGEYWLELVKMAKAKGVRGINNDVLAKLHARLSRVRPAA